MKRIKEYIQGDSTQRGQISKIGWAYDKLSESPKNLGAQRPPGGSSQDSLLPPNAPVLGLTEAAHSLLMKPKLTFEHQELSYEKHPKYLGFILDPEFTCNKHMGCITLQARKRLSILKYITGRDWGADASTLRTSYLALIRPT